MSKPDNEAILRIIDSIQSQLVAVKMMLDSQPEVDDSCTHADMMVIQTMGGTQGAFCNECGAEFGMGVLDKDGNNE